MTRRKQRPDPVDESFDPTPRDGGPGQTSRIPKPLGTAVKLMFLGAALTFCGVIYSSFNTGQVRETVVQRNTARTGSAHLDAAGVDAAVHIAIGVAIVAGLFGTVLWVAMALLNRQGRTWARIVASGLCAFSALSFVYAVAGVLSQGGSARSLVISALNLAIGLGAVLLMYRPQSTSYYQERGAERSSEPLQAPT